MAMAMEMAMATIAPRTLTLSEEDLYDVGNGNETETENENEYGNEYGNGHSSTTDVQAALSDWLLVLYTWMSYAIIGTVVNVACLIFLFWFRTKPIVAMGQPSLLAVMCVGSIIFVFGCMLRQSTQLNGEAFLNDDNWNWNVPCKLSFWLTSLGTFMVELIIFLKLYRVYKVMRFRRGLTVLPRHFIAPFVVGLTVPVVFATLNTILGPGMEYDAGLDLYLCNNHRDKFFWMYQLSVWLLRIALLVLSWRLRYVKESVGDTRRILNWEVYVFVIWALYFVFLFTLRVAPNIREGMKSPTGRRVYFTLVFLPTFLYSLGPSIFLVLPRMYLVCYERVHGHLPYHICTYGAGSVHISAINLNAHGNSRTSMGTTTTTTTTTTINTNTNTNTTATHAKGSATLSRAQATSAEKRNRNVAPTTTITKKTETVGGAGIESSNTGDANESSFDEELGDDDTNGGTRNDAYNHDDDYQGDYNDDDDDDDDANV